MSQQPLLLIAQPLTPEKFAPYGDVITLPGAQQIACNQGRGIRFHDLAPQLDVSDAEGRAGVSVYRIVASQLPFTLHVMERHPLGSQAFIPLNPQLHSRYLVVVAPAGEFQPQAMEAFIVTGCCGVNYAKGVWHLPIVALDQAMEFIAVDRIGTGNNCDEVTLALPVQVVV